MRRNLRRTKRKHFRRSAWRTRLIFWGGAIIVGIVAAMFAVIGEGADHFFRNLIADKQWLPFIVTPLGLVFIAWATRSFFPGAEGSGIPQTLVALDQIGGSVCKRVLSLKIVVGKFLLTLTGLFFGASIGREGPTVHIGAAIMYSIGKYTHISSRYLERGLIITGCGAGVAAAFNTPLGGIMFAIEEMARSFDRRNISMMIIGVVLAGMMAIFVHQNNYNYYGTMPADLDFSWVWAGVVVCGVMGGALGGCFAFLLITGARKLRPFMISHWVIVALVCGFIVAGVGYISGGVTYGSGYIEARQIVSCTGLQHCESDVGFFYPFLKIVATAASFLSGVPAGIFAPTLAAGAGFGSDIAMFFPVEMASTIVVLGMVAYFSGVVQVPITAFVIVMEMTDNQELVLAMMATSLIASGTSKLINRKPIYTALAENFMAAMVLREGKQAVEKQAAG